MAISIQLFLTTNLSHCIKNKATKLRHSGTLQLEVYNKPKWSSPVMPGYFGKTGIEAMEFENMPKIGNLTEKNTPKLHWVGKFK